MRRRSNAVAYIYFKKKMANLSKEESGRLELLRCFALSEMKKHNVQYTFRYTHMWTYLDKCNSSSIRISYTHALHSDIEDVKMTILHEIAHAIVGIDAGHRKEWQDKARELGVTWNINYHT